MQYYRFDCGCKFPMQENGRVSIKLDIKKVPLDCKRTWELISSGYTKGVFQLESNLGKQWTKRLKPENIEHLTALGALLRPGCCAIGTKVAVGLINRVSTYQRNSVMKWLPIERLYQQAQRKYCLYKQQIVSLDEQTGLFYLNRIDNVIYTGNKPVYQPIINLHRRTVNCRIRYNLQCTLDHPLLTHDRGWVNLEDLHIGEYIAVARRLCNSSKATINHAGQKNFRNICFQHYAYHCVFCNWHEASLDVNHLNDNRQKNNNPDNLCFMCPNHHKMYTEGYISEKEVVQARETYRLQNTKDIQWAQYTGIEFVGEKETYDIKVIGPNHNFIANNVVVHNCLRALDEHGVSMTEHYCRRKNGEEPVEVIHQAIESILRPTYGVLTYQEQAMQIAQAIANFNLQDADELRKAIGKKLPEEMEKVRVKFIAGCEKAGIVTAEEAIKIFGWIKESQRYSFNKSHAACYAINGYYCAYCKAHFPVQTYTSWLFHSPKKQAKKGENPKREVRDLINEAKLMNIDVLPPDILNLKPNFYTDGKIITFGLTDIKSVGHSVVKKLHELVATQEVKHSAELPKWTWLQLLTRIGPIKQETGRIGESALANMISAGALRHFNPNRSKLLAELKAWAKLSAGEANFIYEQADKFDNLINAMKAAAPLKKEGGACHSAERKQVVNSLISLLENPPTKLEDSPNWIAGTEEILLGIAITCSRIDACNTSAINATCRDFHDGNVKNQGSIMLGVELQSVQEIKTKKGKAPGSKMARMTITDGTCAIDAICWPEQYKEMQHLLTDGNTVIVQGYRDKKQGTFVVQQAWQAEELLDNSSD